MVTGILAAAGMADALQSVELLVLWLGLLVVCGTAVFALVQRSLIAAALGLLVWLAYTGILAAAFFGGTPESEDPDERLAVEKVRTVAAAWVPVSALVLTAAVAAWVRYRMWRADLPYRIRVAGPGVYITWHRRIDTWSEAQAATYRAEFREAVRQSVDQAAWQLVAGPAPRCEDEDYCRYVTRVRDRLVREFALDVGRDALTIGLYHGDTLAIGFVGRQESEYPWYYRGVRRVVAGSPDGDVARLAAEGEDEGNHGA